MTDDANTPEKPKLRPANENPWYVLATLHGEQLEGTKWHEHDPKLHAMNRYAWNRWVVSWLQDCQIKILLDRKDTNGDSIYSPDELTPYSNEEKIYFLDIFNKRCLDRNCYRYSEINNHNIRIILSNLKFASCAIFNGFLFTGDCDFRNSQFECDLQFQDCIFYSVAYFDNTKFHGDTFWGICVFYNHASFPNTRFANVCWFAQVEFHDFVDFRNASLAGVSSFEKAIFSNKIHFKDTQFNASTSFASASFITHPPKFHGATLHEGTEWHGATWPAAPAVRKEAQQHVYNYERLKQEMERLKKHEDELKFFALEMRAKRVVDGKWSPAGLINAAYDWLSGYGRSVLRPAYGFAATLLLGALPIALWMGGARADWFWLPKFKNAFGLSLANVLAPVGIRKDFIDAELLAEMPVWVKLLGGAQTLFGLLFAFLIGLALRNRFRLK